MAGEAEQEQEQEPKQITQYIAALIATIGGCVMGTWLAWSSPAQEEITSGKYGFECSKFQFSLIGAFVSVGAMIGSLTCGTVCNMIGRRYTSMVLVVPALIGAALMLWAVNPIMMMLGRLVIGIPVGAFSVVSPLYTNEISQTSIRGILGTFFQLQVNLGILTSYVLGLIKSTFILTMIDAIFPIILTILMIFLPETPYYLLMINKEEEAKKSLQWLRGKDYKVDKELAIIKENITKMQEEKLSYKEAFMTKYAKKGLAIGVTIMILQQLSGINAVIFYSSSIFKSSGSSLNDLVGAIIVGLMCFFSTGASIFFIDRVGRKPLLLLSCSVMALANGVLGIYYFLQKYYPDTSKKILFLPLVAICVFIIVFSVGLGPIPWMILAEIFPPNIRGPASSISCLTNWIFTFIVTFSFHPFESLIGSHFVFWIFAIIMVLGCVFIIFIIPETKGKTINEVQKELEGKSTEKVEKELEGKSTEKVKK